MRYRQIKGRPVTENVADDPHTNAKIVEILKKYDPDTQARLHDALEAVKMAGAQGIGVAEWASYVRSISGDEGYSMKDLLTAAVKEFPFLIRRMGDKRYGWVTGNQPDDAPDDMQGPIAAQVGLTYDVKELMRHMGRFSEDDLVREVVQRTGMPMPVAQQFVAHTLQQFGGLVQRTGPGQWIYVPEKTQTTADHMAAFKDMVRKKPPA